MPSLHDVMCISCMLRDVMCHLLPTVYGRTLANRSKNNDMGDYFCFWTNSKVIFETPHVVCDDFDPCVTTKYMRVQCMLLASYLRIDCW